MRLRPLVLLAAIPLAVLLAGPPVVLAQPAPATEFYTPPGPLPDGQPGDLIRTEPLTPILPLPARATRIMYRSTDTHGAAVAVTGTVLDPAAPWTGPGPRPIVGFTVGTHGQGDQCAPSRLLGELVHYTPPLDVMAEYEYAFLTLLLAQGIAVAVTDYQGLGTPGVHTYLNPIAEAHADIDAVRAARRLPGTGIPADAPVAFWGYSQGGNAAGAAAEHVAGYAPELPVRGSYVGAPPADLLVQLPYFEHNIFKALTGQVLNGLRAVFPDTGPAIDAIVNDNGRAMLAAVADECIPELAPRYGLHPTNGFTVSGRPLGDAAVADPVISAALAQLRLGTLTPNAPVLVTTGSGDDIVEPDQVRRLAADWCAHGATVQLAESPFPTTLPGTGTGHIANAFILNLGSAVQWLRDRFAAIPAPSTC
ncbi:lipase family protein [Nocardia sp. NPDC050718]|uniref:lipase family protein n=1 Tax=Nocardia sp. NPDC050718 TaxID=3155788 RepID=UPI0033D6AA12